jgi:hypothetical protein
MSGLSSENWMAIIGGIVLLIWSIAIFSFGRITVKYLEQEMLKEGINPPTWDKGIGGRIIMYAMVIVTKKSSQHSLINDEAILRHTRKKDYNLGVFFIISSILFFTILAVFSIFFSPDN